MALDWTNKVDGVDEVKAKDVNDLAHAIQDMEANPAMHPYINSSTGHWMVWNATTEQYEDSGVAASGFVDANVIDSLNSQSATDALSANQGYVLNGILATAQLQLNVLNDDRGYLASKNINGVNIDNLRLNGKYIGGNLLGTLPANIHPSGTKILDISGKDYSMQTMTSVDTSVATKRWYRFYDTGGGFWGAWKEIGNTETSELTLLNGWTNVNAGVWGNLRLTKTGNTYSLNGIISNPSTILSGGVVADFSDSDIGAPDVAVVILGTNDSGNAKQLYLSPSKTLHYGDVAYVAGENIYL